MTRYSRFKANQTGSAIYRHRMAAQQEGMREVEKRYHLNQAQIEEDALRLHGWELSDNWGNVKRIGGE